MTYQRLFRGRLRLPRGGPMSGAVAAGAPGGGKAGAGGGGGGRWWRARRRGGGEGGGGGGGGSVGGPAAPGEGYAVTVARSGASASLQAMIWSSIGVTVSRWNAAGLNSEKFSKSVKRES